MKIIIGLSILFVLLLIEITVMFLQKQKKIKKKIQKVKKYELIETSNDELYYEYYEPKIIKVLPGEDIL